VLALARPGRETLRVALVQAGNLLQEHDVRLERAQALAQLVDHHAAIELRQSLVDVQGDDAQFLRSCAARS
jgi:hypothetical protein